jgi:hypothetical protein
MGDRSVVGPDAAAVAVHDRQRGALLLEADRVEDGLQFREVIVGRG